MLQPPVHAPVFFYPGPCLKNACACVFIAVSASEIGFSIKNGLSIGNGSLTRTRLRFFTMALASKMHALAFLSRFQHRKYVSASKMGFSIGNGSVD
jgi:hypothetical protein